MRQETGPEKEARQAREMEECERIVRERVAALRYILDCKEREARAKKMDQAIAKRNKR